MRTLFSILLLSIGSLFASGLAAQNTGGSPPVHECTRGCYLVSCRSNADVCALFFCENGRCDDVTTFTRPEEQQESALLPESPRSSVPLSAAPGTRGIAVEGPVGVNTCSATTCRQFVLHQGGIREAGSSENPQHTLRRALERQDAQR